MIATMASPDPSVSTRGDAGALAAETPADGALDARDRAELLSLARRALTAYLEAGSMSALVSERARLRIPGAAFVSLHRGETLRGCIGIVDARHSLDRAVQEMAVGAASRDPRFEPLARDELASVHIEISVLHGDTVVAATDAESVVRIGEHGVMILGHGARGLLLPQVAPEHGWDAATLLEHTCRKAGLAGEAWRDPAVEIHLFRADVFSEPPELPEPPEG
jgi:AmmeMemoRadiSam system protein A